MILRGEVIMKRYRVINISFDSRATILNTEIKEEWEEEVKMQWRQNKQFIVESIIHAYGANNFEDKVSNFSSFGVIPFSIVAFHNKFFKQIRDSFILGSYYPALTAACSLGERILNHLILLLRDDYKNTVHYRNVYSKKSFDNWDKMIVPLNDWGALLPEVVDKFNELKSLRNYSIHFNPDTDVQDKKYAQSAIDVLKKIIELQFGVGGPVLRPWFINSIPGAFYISKEAEDWPFVKKVILPNCILVGHKHKLENDGSWFEVIDDHDYEDKEITDEEFKDLLVTR